MFNSAYAIGCLLAPIAGGLFNDLYGYRATCDIMAFASITYAAIYFLIVLLPYLYYRRKNLNEQGSLVSVVDKFKRSGKSPLVREYSEILYIESQIGDGN